MNVKTEDMISFVYGKTREQIETDFARCKRTKAA